MVIAMEEPGFSSRFDFACNDSGHQAISEVERQKTSVEMLEGDESEVELVKPKKTKMMLFTHLASDCLVKVFEFIPLKDQLNCLKLWPEWCGNILLTHKQLVITETVKSVDEMSEEMVFGEKGLGFLNILDNLHNLGELDVSTVDHRYQQQIVEDIGRERRKFRVIKLERCGGVDYDAFKRMVDGVPQLEEFRCDFDYSNHTDDCVTYLLTRAKHLHSIDLSGSDMLTSDVFRGVGTRFKVIRIDDCLMISADILDHILDSSQYSLEELCLIVIPFSRIKTLIKFKNLKVVPLVSGPGTCLQPMDSPTEVSCLFDLKHLQEINIRGCFHDADIRGMSGSWKEMRDLTLYHWFDASHQPSYESLMSLRYMTSIERMALWYMKNVNDHHVEVFSKELVKLKILQLYTTSVTGKGLKYLANLPDIEVIECLNDDGVMKLFANDEEKEEVISDLNAPQRKRGREFRIVRAGLNGLHLNL